MVQEESSSSEITISEESSLDSDMDTEELEELEAQQGYAAESNKHGFVYAAELNTYRMSKKERTEARELEKAGQEKKKYLSNA